MDENAIVEVLKSGLNLASTSISAIVGAVITTLFLWKNTKTSEFEKIKAGKYKEVIDQLLGSGKMSYLEYHKCNNFLDIAKIADKSMADIHGFYGEKTSGNSDFNFDWFIRFFEAASNISNENMQKFWAAFLAGEVYRGGSYSLRAIDTLYNMTALEAELFSNVSKMVIDGKMILSSFQIFENNSNERKIGERINSTYSFDNDSLRLLEECGIINGLLMRNKLELEPNEDYGFTCGDKLLLFKPSGNKKVIIEYVSYFLTMVGIQLYPITSPGTDNHHLIDLGKEMKKSYPELTVSLHPINLESVYIDDLNSDEDCISYNNEIDLLE